MLRTLTSFSFSEVFLTSFSRKISYIIIVFGQAAAVADDIPNRAKPKPAAIQF